MIGLQKGGESFFFLMRHTCVSLLVFCLWGHSIWGQSILSSPTWIENQERSTSVVFDTVAKENLETKESLLLDSQNTTQSSVYVSILEKIERFPRIAQQILEQEYSRLTDAEQLSVEVQISFHLGQVKVAEELAHTFVRQYIHHTDFPLIYYYWNKALFLQQKPINTISSFHTRLFNDLDQQKQIDFLHMLTEHSIREGSFLSAIGYSLEKISYLTSFDETEEKKLIALLQQLDLEEELILVQDMYPENLLLQREIPFLRLELLLEREKYEEASALLNVMLFESETMLESQMFARLLEWQRKLNIAQNVDPYRIGVILPLSSKQPLIVKLVEESLSGIRLAIIERAKTKQGWDSSEETSDGADSKERQAPEILAQGEALEEILSPTRNFEIILRDSELNPEATRNAVQELVEQEKVIAIIGPLIRSTSEAAAQEAQRLKIPMISLSVTTEIPEVGSYIFRNNQSWEQEMRTLVRYAIDYQHASKFLILYSSTREGKQKMKSVWEEVETLGAQVQGVEIFSPRQTNFTPQFQSLTGMNRKLSPEEKEEFAETNEKPSPSKGFDTLVIIVGKQHTQDLQVILPYLPVYEMQNIVLLGDSGWNNRSLHFYLSQQEHNLAFVDSFFQQSREAKVRNLLHLHEQYYFKSLNYTGPSSYTAYSYDTLQVLWHLLERTKTPQGLKHLMLTMQPFEGVTGKLSFAKNGEIRGNVILLTLRKNQIISIF